MLTYIILNTLFLAAILVLFNVRPRKPSTPWLLMFVSLILITLIFDSLMISLGFFYYTPEKILGVIIGKAPIEDFFYAILAAIIIPALWYKLEKK